MHDPLIIFLLPSGVSVASEARPIIAFYSRFRDICIYINQSINQSMALSASCAGHTRTQSHAALYKINNEVVHSGMVASDYKRGSE